jgi:outer membrane receptor protein involved in Fe transport
VENPGKREQSGAVEMKKRSLFTLTLAIQAALFAPLALAQTDNDQAAEDEEETVLEEVVVVGSQMRGAAISEALAVSVLNEAEIEATGVASVDELLDILPEQGQNFQNEAENISGGVNAVRGDVGAFNLRNMGTGNTLVLLNGRRLVQTAGYQTELVGGSFVPVNSVNPNAIPTTGIRRVEVLRDGASAIYGADAVAGVVNTVLQNDFEGLTVQARYDWYDNVSRDDQRLNIKWGKNFNEGRTNISVFADYYHRDRVNGNEDPRWASEMRWRLPEDSPWLYDEDGDPVLSFRNTSVNSGYGQWDAEERSLLGTRMDAAPWTDSGGEFELFPLDHPACQHPDAWEVPASTTMCALRDGVNRDEYGSATGVRFDTSGNDAYGRDINSDLDRYNLFLFLTHEFENGVEAYTEVSYYDADTNLIRHPSATLTGFEMVIGAQNYYNPFGPCDSPNRVPDLPESDVPCEGIPVKEDFYRWVEYPRIVDNKAETWRVLQGFRGTWGDWDWDTALVWSEAERTDITRNRISNTLMWEALQDPTPAAYNPFAVGEPGEANGSNIERALIDVYRKNETDLKMVDFKISNPELFDLRAGPVGFLAGAEYREESYVDDRDPRLDGTIQFTYPVNGTTFPYVSDVMNSSPSADGKGSRDTTSLFVEFAVPLLRNLDMQAALRWEDASDYGSTTVGKIALGWRAFEPLLIRGSWSEAFRAPNLITVNEGLVVRSNSRTSYVCRYAEEMWDAGRDPDDPRYGEATDELDCSDNVQRRAEGSEELVPEESTNISIGMVWDVMDDLTLTFDYWEIEKEDTIGLVGETNHSLIDTLLHIENGRSNCDSFTGNPAMGYYDPNPANEEYFAHAGICSVGQWQFVNDRYANLDKRVVEGWDAGAFYSVDTKIGSWDLSLRGSFYETYEQKAGPLMDSLIEAGDSGVFPAGFPTPTGYGDLRRQDGNQTKKYSANLRWRLDDFGAGLSASYLGDFVQTSLGIREGQKFVIPSMTTVNGYFDYYADLFETDTRFRLGIRNLTDERAPLADRYFGYFADAHRDLGRYYYVDIRMGF